MVHHALNGSAMNLQDKPVILIADDSRVVRVSLKNILKNDCQLIEAEDGQQAWELLLETPHVQLIISDLSMPRIDGRGLLKKIRSSEINRVRNIPFIVVTGNEKESGTREELQDMGATEVVAKPFDPASIVSFVTTLVSKQESDSYMLLPEDESQTQHLSDALNQNEFMQLASKELSFAVRNKNELAIALLRIDQFDQLATHYSETALDHILITSAEIIRQHIHPDDAVAYFGNGLFAILRPASNAIGTRYIGRRILEDITAKQFYLGDSGEVVSASIGVSAPQIKPGIRLRELLLLAEGRLKAAMDLGGNRVIDKGNDTLTPVNVVSDSIPALSAENSSQLNSEGVKSANLETTSASDRQQRRQTTDTQELEEKIDQLRSRMESLTHENRDLQNQIERWRKQSGESEKLRRRIFELESEQQQMQLKINELSTNNAELQNRVNSADSEQKKLLAGEQDQNITLKQANQFYEQENVRLEGQVGALSNRTQKAELAFRKSQQLVLSLKDNIKLLRAQLEQAQRERQELRQQTTMTPTPAATEDPLADDTTPVVDRDTHPIDEPPLVGNGPDSSLHIDGFPSTSTLTEASAPAPVVQLFAEPSLPASSAQSTAPPATESTPPTRTEEPTKSFAPVNGFQSIPVYHSEPEEEKFRESRPLSSFSIASLIMLTLLSLGGGYFYLQWQKDVVPDTTLASTAQASPASVAGKQRSVEQKWKEPNATSQVKRPVATDQTDSDAEQPMTTSQVAGIAERTLVEHSGQIASPDPQPRPVTDEDARLEAEQALRQVAEEEFRSRLQNANRNGSGQGGIDGTGNAVPGEAPRSNLATKAPATTEGIQPNGETD